PWNGPDLQGGGNGGGRRGPPPHLRHRTSATPICPQGPLAGGSGRVSGRSGDLGEPSLAVLHRTANPQAVPAAKPRRHKVADGLGFAGPRGGMMRFAIGLLALLVLPASSPGQPSRPLSCVQDQKTTLNNCQAAARAVCDSGFRAAVPSCFGTASACAVSCLDARDACEEGPDARQAGCQQRCSDNERGNRQACSARQDSGRCTLL